MIKVRDWDLKHSNVVASPIANDTLLVKDEETCKFFVCFNIYYFHITNLNIIIILLNS